STLEMMEKGKIPRYMNTYKLWSDNPFNAEVVHKILVEIVDETIVKLIYEPDKVPKLAKWASGAIRTKVKELNFDRYPEKAQSDVVGELDFPNV
ncbi:tctex1 domain-containing protein 2-like, partial [Agrilus planipennis]|uniref:Tctex1 domain-containing protein 2-like n=1 Tax=Agrilus planipennis TaxID=224129 RepID=A0A1W4XPQ6_AGRPL